MSTETLLKDTLGEKNFEEMISRLVDQKINERFGALEQQMTDIQSQLKALEQQTVSDKVTLLVFSGDFDKLVSAFIIGAGAVGMGMDVSMYFTFWGLSALKKKNVYSGKPITEKMMAMMIPVGPEKVGTSKLNMLGMGPAFFKMMMKKNHVESLPDFIRINQELGVQMIACQMTMGIMGISQDELIDELEYGGAATYLQEASDSKVTLFI